MLVSYDFDIRWIIPRDLEADPRIGEMLSDIGFNADARGNYVAVFRDPRVVAMIERADPVLRACLKASGFGFVASGSGLPPGYYPAEDEGALTDVIARLNENLPKFDLEGADLGGFDFAALLEAAVAAEPLPEGRAPVRPPRVQPRPPATPPRAPQSGEVSIALAPLGKLGAVVLNLVGLSLLIFLAVKLFAGPPAL